MAKRREVVLSLVERGWQAAREQSLTLQQEEVAVVHLIKGTVSSEVLALVIPYPAIRLVSVPRSWFWPQVLGWVMWGRWRGSLRGVLVDNARTERRTARWLQGTAIPVTRV